jgi:O-antigen ligase
LVTLVSPQAHLAGGLVYVSIILAAIVCGTLVLTAPMLWWRRVSFVIGVWCLLVLQVLLLGVFALMTGGLEGIQ